jgi:GNAT superfamily N-acetyltransferase
MSTEQKFIIRPATPTDMPAILTMQARSLRTLGRGHYDPETLESVIAAGTASPELLRGRRYRVAVLNHRIVGSGGWLDGGHSAPMPLARAAAPAESGAGAAAVVRAIYVDPDMARRGIGTAIMASIERDAAVAGKSRALLLATRMSVRFYSRLGYRSEGPLSLASADGPLVEVIAMSKALLPLPATRRLARTGSEELVAAA